jgi:eukaryotic-like serine/threonine-protein kinase
MGPVERLAEKDGSCERRVVLADEYLLSVAARHKQGWSAPLCSIAEAMTTDALAVLSRGPVPRRTESFPAESLGSADACKLLTQEEVAQETGVGLPPDRFPIEPDVGSWNCWWGKDPVEADIFLKRSYPLDSEDGKPIKVAGKDAFVEVQKSGDDGHDACVVDVIHRQYHKDVAWNDTWQDIASLTLETEENISQDQLCAKAIKLAEKMVPRLPKV